MRTYLLCTLCIGCLYQRNASFSTKGIVLLALMGLLFTPSGTIGQSGNLNQIRNGPAGNPSRNFYATFTNPKWVNGNAGSSNAHYVEGMSIAYRSLITGAAAGQSYEYVIEYDTQHSGRMAIDYLTHYQRLEPHGPFGHAAEVIDPRIFKSGRTEYLLGVTSTNTFPIPAPFQEAANTPVAGMPQNSFNALPANEKLMTIYNGVITAITYDFQQSLTSAATESKTRIRIRFTAGKDSVVLAWGGHIASRLDWGFINPGTPRSAGGISGSRYHMRQKSMNTYPGLVNISGVRNQDRSLFAAAVVPPPESSGPPCDIGGSTLICPGTTNQYVGFGPVPSGFTYTWSLLNNTNNASISGATNGAFIEVIAGTSCNTSYTVHLHIESVSGFIKSDCEKTVFVQENIPPVFTSCPPDLQLECSSNTDPVNTGTATATDNCFAEVSYSDETISKNCFTYINRTWTATDPCGNTSTCLQRIFLTDRTPPTLICPPNEEVNCGDPIPTPVSFTFFENCSPLFITPLFRDVPAGASGCPANPNNLLRTWTAIDASGNIATCHYLLSFVTPVPIVNNTTTIIDDSSVRTGKAVTVTTQPVDKTVSIPLKGNLSALQLSADPNPYSSVINFRFVSPQSGHAMLEVYNLTGAKMAVVYKGNVTAGLVYTVNYKVPVSQQVPLIYKLSVGANSAQGKLLSFGRNFNQ